jgi:hypothetical protein
MPSKGNSSERQKMPRRQPKIVLGGSMIRAANGYRAIPQYTPIYPTPMTVKQIYSNARQRRYTPSWDGAEPDAKQIIYFTDPIRIWTGCCHRSLGPFVAYNAGGEYGVIRDEARQRHPIGSLPAEELARQPNDRFDAKSLTFWIDGEVGGKAAKAWACFRCLKCGHEFNPRNLRKLGKSLFEGRPDAYELSPP